MKCRDTAPLTALIRHETASRAPFRSPARRTGAAIHRRLRILRHRALRWFHDPVATIERERRERELGPSLWRYDFRPWSTLAYAATPRRRLVRSRTSLHSTN